MNNVTFTSGPNDRYDDPRKIWKERNADPLSNVTSNSELLRVIIKVNDLVAWKQLKAIQYYGIITSSTPGEWIVTTQIDSNQLNYIRSQPFVVSVEYGRLVGPTDSIGAVTTSESKITGVTSLERSSHAND